jgi:ribosomal protein S18 acetylase RimI-like enzyme
MLRRARPEDAAALSVILRTAMRGAMPSLPELHTPDDDHRFLSDVVLPNEEVWVAEIDGTPVGFVALGSRSGLDFLQHMYVAPQHQRRGLGTKLIERAKERRPTGFRLWVFQENVGARHFYERHGLRLVELTDGSRNEEREPDALYEWVPVS